MNTSEVTPGTSLQAWHARWLRDDLHPLSEDMFIASGVPVTDLRAFTASRWDATPPVHHPVAVMYGDLVRLCTFHPEMSLHAGIGWTLLDAVRRGNGPVESGVMERWVAADMSETGWLFDAAGLSPDEAHTLIATGGDDDLLDGVRVLAALSGMPAPSAPVSA